MDEALRALRVNAIELLRQPGATRDVAVTAGGATLGVVHARLAGEIAAELTLESINDGIIVTGEVRAPWSTSCRRCLKDISGVAVAAVEERYQVELTDDDAYAIEGTDIDLAPMVREVALLELDNEQLCAPDCAGLCPICGVDHNTTECDCDTTVTDDRWAALDDLVLDD